MPKVNNNIEDTVRTMVTPLVEHAGFELVDLEYTKEGSDWILRLYIDHENGIDHEACQTVSNLVGDELDKFDPIPQSYLLEVSSPGIERPLKASKDFNRFSGEKIYIKLFAPKNGKKEFTGKLLGMEQEQIALMVNETKLLFNMDEIAKARLVADFD